MKKLSNSELNQKFEELLDYIDKIKNQDLRDIAKKILIENKNKIVNRAASPDRIEKDLYISGNHHFYRGGLLCHLLGVTKLAIKISEEYDDIVDMDSLIFGAAFHDIGKIYTYEEWDETGKLKNPSNKHSKMLQHTYLGMTMISKYFDEKASFDSDYKESILHIIASHMTGAPGALVSPTTIEATIVSEADHLDCMLSKF